LHLAFRLGDSGFQRALHDLRIGTFDTRGIGMLPALELAGENRNAARQADEVDNGGKRKAQRAVPLQHRADEIGGHLGKQRLSHRLASSVHANPRSTAKPKPATVVPTRTAVARRMRLSARVHAMAPPHRTGTISAPISSRVCDAPGTQTA